MLLLIFFQSLCHGLGKSGPTPLKYSDSLSGSPWHNFTTPVAGRSGSQENDPPPPPPWTQPRVQYNTQGYHCYHYLCHPCTLFIPRTIYPHPIEPKSVSIGWILLLWSKPNPTQQAYSGNCWWLHQLNHEINPVPPPLYWNYSKYTFFKNTPLTPK